LNEELKEAISILRMPNFAEAAKVVSKGKEKTKYYKSVFFLVVR